MDKIIVSPFLLTHDVYNVSFILIHLDVSALPQA